MTHSLLLLSSKWHNPARLATSVRVFVGLWASVKESMRTAVRFPMAADFGYLNIGLARSFAWGPWMTWRPFKRWWRCVTRAGSRPNTSLYTYRTWIPLQPLLLKRCIFGFLTKEFERLDMDELDKEKWSSEPRISLAITGRSWALLRQHHPQFLPRVSALASPIDCG